MGCLKLQITSVLKSRNNWTRNGWPTARTKTSLSISDTNLWGTILTANRSSLDLCLSVHVFFTSKTWPNAPSPRLLIIWKSSTASLGWSVTQPMDNNAKWECHFLYVDNLLLPLRMYEGLTLRTCPSMCCLKKGHNSLLAMTPCKNHST